jgi:hypothetical protein
LKFAAKIKEVAYLVRFIVKMEKRRGESGSLFKKGNEA